MFGFHDISIEFLTGSPGLTVLGLALLVALAVWLYRRTNPPLPTRLRVILAGLRIVAVLALIAALLEPVIGYSRQFERQPRLALLLDKSRSMERLESGKSRTARVDSLLSSETFAGVTDRSRVDYWYFGANIGTAPDTVNADMTALGTAIDQVKSITATAKPDLWLLLSDGRSNSGRHPVEAASAVRAPILTFNLAEETGGFDLSLGNVEYNPVLFAGQKTEITVGFSWRSGSGQQAKAQLLDRHVRVLAEQSLALSEPIGLGELALSFTPMEPGQHLYTVRVISATSEESTDNNSRTIAVKVLKSRLAVLLVTKRPDHEVGFLRRQMLRSDEYDVDLRVTGQRAGNLAGTMPTTQAELNRFDLVILHDPDPSELESRVPLLNSYLRDRGGAIWVLMGEQFAVAGPSPSFSKLLPFWQSRRMPLERYEFHAEPAETHLFHPAIRLADDRAAVRNAWSKLPPFSLLVPCDSVDPGSAVLAFSADPRRPDRRFPVLGYRRHGSGKLMATAAMPLWTWGFVDLGTGGSGEWYGRFLEGTSRWLTVRDDLDPIRIVPEKEVFSRGEPVRFNGYAFDQGYRPMTGVTGALELVDSLTGQTYAADFLNRSEGRLEALLANVAPGAYHYRGSLSKEGQLLTEASGMIAVERFSIEEFDQRGDPAALMAVANASGGRFWRYQEFDSLRSFPLRPVKESVKGELSLWGQGWLLAICLAAFCLEWLIRKIYHLL